MFPLVEAGEVWAAAWSGKPARLCTGILSNVLLPLKLPLPQQQKTWALMRRVIVVNVITVAGFASVFVYRG